MPRLQFSRVLRWFVRSPSPARRPRRRAIAEIEVAEERLLLSATATPIRDVMPGTGSSQAGDFVNVGGTLYFAAADPSSGVELWKSNGTSAGTVRVKDIFPGPSGAFPNGLTNVNGTLYFSATDGVNGYELWKSDGTAAGTVMVRNIRSGAGDSNPGQMANLNGALYFRANDGTAGYELWKSNGTSAGTVLVKDIYAGPDSSFPRYLTNVNGLLYFRANDGASGFELWKSDGTTGGTALLTDILPGNGSSSPSSLVNMNGSLYFGATDGSTGRELWKSSGTAAGTVRVADLASGAADSSPLHLASVNGTLFFAATTAANGRELWKSNGTAAGTMLVRDIRTGASDSSPTALVNVNGTLYFNSNDGASGAELWKSDGTAGGTTRVTDLLAGAVGSDPRYLANVSGRLYFSANDGNTGIEPWSVQDDVAPVILQPPATTPSPRPLIAWYAGAGATSFDVWFRNDSTRQNPVLQSATSTPSFSPASDFGIGRYSVWVRSVSSAGSRTDWSSIRRFTINTPVALLPIESAQLTARPELRWTPLPGAVMYDVWIDNVSTGQKQVLRNQAVPGASLIPPTDLPMGTYRAWVRGIDASGLAAQWSSAVEFNVVPAPMPSAPLDATFDRRPTLIWNPVSGASRYEMQLQNLATRKTVASVQNINETNWRPAADLTTGHYRWWVRAIGPGELAGVWSSAADFHVGGQTRIITPVGTGTDTTPTFSWRPVDGATTWRLWVDRIDVSQSKVLFRTDLTTTSFTPTVAMAAGSYRVWVQAVSGNGTASPWSPTVSFTITANADGSGPAAEASLLTVVLPGTIPAPDANASVRRWPGRSADHDDDSPPGAVFDQSNADVTNGDGHGTMQGRQDEAIGVVPGRVPD